MKAIIYICDAIGCDVEETVVPKAPAPEGWAEIQVLVGTGRLGDRPTRTIVLCPTHVSGFYEQMQEGPEVTS